MTNLSSTQPRAYDGSVSVSPTGTTQPQMKVIKRTKSIVMWADETEVAIRAYGDATLHIPVKNVFQVIRGLISYTQKFHRKAKKK